MYLLSLLLLSLVCSKAEEHVLVLTNSNFDDIIKEHEHILVEFYAPWCGHCKALEPEYTKAAGMLKDEGSAIKLAKVDATEEKELAQKFAIRGFPTLKFFRNGSPIDYEAAREADAIVSWCKKKTQPSVKILETSEQAKSHLDAEGIKVMGYAKDTTSKLYDAFVKVADKLDSISFGWIKEHSVAGEHSMGPGEQLVLFKNFDEMRVEYKGPFTEEAIMEFIQVEIVPMVVEFTPESASTVFGSPIKKHVIAFCDKSKEFEAVKGYLATSAKTFKGKAHFVIIDTEVEDNIRVMEFFGLQASDVPAVRAIDMSKEMIKYKPESDAITAESVSSFIQGVLDGTIKPHLMSEDEADDDHKDGVLRLVGKSFDKHCRDPSKSVLVMLYAPWCGHCQKLKPVWDELGKHYEDHSSIIIAKMDSTKNEVEGLTVEGFPTIKYFPKGSDKVVPYEGGRTLEDFKKFLDSDGVPSDTGATKEAESEDEGVDGRDEL